MLVLILQKLDDLEVFLVTGAGNGGYTLDLDGYPALYRNQLDNLVVAGGTDAWGCRYLGSQGGETSTPLVEVYAPGYGVSVANSIGSIKISDGTSIGEYFCYMAPVDKLTSNTSASATVAGLAAYLQAKEGYSQNSFLKERILELQWARPEQPSDGSSQQRGFKCVNQWPNAIYNGARDGYTCPIGKRQVGGACSSSPPPTGTAGAVQSPITFTSGPPSPSCTAGCGTLCDSPNFCLIQPTQTARRIQITLAVVKQPSHPPAKHQGQWSHAQAVCYARLPYRALLTQQLSLLSQQLALLLQ
jgi:hypothetical protein